MTSTPLRIGIAGLGTVGASVVKILQAHGEMIAQRAGRPVAIVAVNAKNSSKERGVDLNGYEWVSNPLDLANRDDIDVIVELIGGEDGVAKQLVEAALKSGKHVVSANKAMIAKHGFALAELADKHSASLNYEAAVAGGIPVIKALREGFAGNEISGIYGILNGTCNYILSEMRTTGRDFSEVLKEAQEKGYAEADPTFDIDGIDAAHKLTILAALAFGIRPDFASVDITGIRHITATDIGFANELGYRIKLLGMAKRGKGGIHQSMEPCLVPVTSALGNVEGVFNAVFTEGDFVDRSMLEGRGAGGGPTASAVVADLVDLARGLYVPVFGVPAVALAVAGKADTKDMLSEQYVHLVVKDEPGVIADVSAILRDYNISIETMIQRGRDPGQPVSVVIMTHHCAKDSINAAALKISSLPSVMAVPTILRVQQF